MRCSVSTICCLLSLATSGEAMMACQAASVTRLGLSATNITGAPGTVLQSALHSQAREELGAPLEFVLSRSSFAGKPARNSSIYSLYSFS